MGSRVRLIRYYFHYLHCCSNFISSLVGNVYIADQYNNRLRKVTVSTGIITTIAGTGSNSYSGDNGPATSSTLYSPIGVAVDLSGTIIASAFMPYLDLV